METWRIKINIVYVALEKNKNLKEKILQKPGKSNAETINTRTKNVEECLVAKANKIIINEN